MTKKNIESTVVQYLEPFVLENNYEIVDVEYVKEGSTWYLRIYIDQEGGITIEDCEKTSRFIETVLDEKDPIKIPYILEVSSPGLDRALKKESDFVRFKGRIVDVKLYKAINHKKEYQGELQGLIDGKVIIVTDEGETLSFAHEEIAIVRLAIIF